jgi:hypothetical protein
VHSREDLSNVLGEWQADKFSDFLRQMPKLKNLGYVENPPSVEEFWKHMTHEKSELELIAANHLSVRQKMQSGF